MFAALFASTVFTLVVATLAARSKHAGQIIVPALDILQSVPILGFLTFTVTFFMNLFPGNVLGVELASVFAIFTSQAWNMAFSFYQSLRACPPIWKKCARALPCRRCAGSCGSICPCHARAGVERDDVDVGRLVLRGRVRSDHRGQHHRHPARHRLLSGAGDPASGFRRGGLGGGHDGAGHLAYDQLFFRPIVAWADRFRLNRPPAPSAPKLGLRPAAPHPALPLLLAPLSALGACCCAGTGRRARRARRARANPWAERLWQALVWLGVAAALGWTALRAHLAQRGEVARPSVWRCSRCCA
jgi:NitT/TauT family transport system permease protein